MAGGLRPCDLKSSHVTLIQSSYESNAQATRRVLDVQVARLLRQLQEHGAPDLRHAIVKTPRESPRVTQPMQAELARLVACPNMPLRWIILCAADAGLRFATAANIRVCDTANGRIKRVTKYGAVADLPLTQRLSALLACASIGCEPNDTRRIIDLLEGRPLRAWNTTLHERWKRWKKECQVRPEVRIHDLRRSIAHRVYAATSDLRVVQSLLGHRNLTSTLHYLHAQSPRIDLSMLETAITAAERIKP